MNNRKKKKHLVMVRVSVVVPIYNVSQYIERCVRSLFEQTLQDIEYIFVNDCTPDASIAILEKLMEEYPARKKQSQVIHHEKNQGLACSRIDGVKVATGKYIIHCDSDDWVDTRNFTIRQKKLVLTLLFAIFKVNTIQEGNLKKLSPTSMEHRNRRWKICTGYRSIAWYGGL